MSGVALPQPTSTSSHWQLVDWRILPLQSQPAAGGLATVEGPQLPGDEMWLVDHAVIQCDSSTPTRLRLYEATVQPLALLSGSDRGGFDEAEWPNGLLIRPSAHLVAQWSGASDGAVGTLNLQARVLRRVSS